MQLLQYMCIMYACTDMPAQCAIASQLDVMDIEEAMIGILSMSGYTGLLLSQSISAGLVLFGQLRKFSTSLGHD